MMITTIIIIVSLQDLKKNILLSYGNKTNYMCYLQIGSYD